MDQQTNSRTPDEQIYSKPHNSLKKNHDSDTGASTIENGVLSAGDSPMENCVGENCGEKEAGVPAQEGVPDEADKALSNGEIFSPDLSENVITVISSQAEGGSAKNKGDTEGCDDYDTHSDSFETLEEDSPHDDSQEQLSDSLLQQIKLTNSLGEKEGDSEQGKVALTADCDRFVDDTTSTDSHEVIAETALPANIAPARPESLSLPRSQQYLERNRSTSDAQGAPGSKPCSRGEGSGHQRTRSEAIDIQAVRGRGDLEYGDDVMSRSLPHGTIIRKGDLIEFVADDLQEKIKRSSPMSRADSGSMGSRRSSERSIASTSSATSASTSMATSSGLSRSPSSLLTQSPDACPPIDPAAIIELEMSARRVADSVDLMMGNIQSNLHKMSAITVGCLEAYKTSVDITCDSVDSSIKSMYALMAKCEELSKTMEPVHQIGAQIKEIKRLLDLFEAQLSEKF